MGIRKIYYKYNKWGLHQVLWHFNLKIIRKAAFIDLAYERLIYVVIIKCICVYICVCEVKNISIVILLKKFEYIETNDIYI